MANSTIEKLLAAGLQLTEMSKKQAESFVAKLVKAGDVQRQEAERVTQELLDRGRETSERLAGMVRAELERELGWLSDRVDELEGQLTELAERVGAPLPPRRSGAGRPPRTAAAPKRKSPAGSTSAPSPKKAAPKKKAAKKRAAKKSAAKKSAAKSSAGTKASARPEPVGSSGVPPVATRRES